MPNRRLRLAGQNPGRHPGERINGESSSTPPAQRRSIEARVLDDLGGLYERTGRLALGDADAVSAWRRAAELFRELGLPDTVRVEGRLAAAVRD
jgi:hypothetical protein